MTALQHLRWHAHTSFTFLKVESWTWNLLCRSNVIVFSLISISFLIQYMCIYIMKIIITRNFNDESFFIIYYVSLSFKNDSFFILQFFYLHSTCILLYFFSSQFMTFRVRGRKKDEPRGKLTIFANNFLTLFVRRIASESIFQRPRDAILPPTQHRRKCSIEKCPDWSKRRAKIATRKKKVNLAHRAFGSVWFFRRKNKLELACWVKKRWRI